MIFLSVDDFSKVIKDDILDRIINSDQTLLDDAELAVVKEMQSYINHRYDGATIFAQTGSDRNPLIVMYAVDMLLYHIHSRLNPRQISDVRRDRYDAALQFLRAIASGELSPDLPKSATDTGIIAYHGPQRRPNRY